MHPPENGLVYMKFAHRPIAARFFLTRLGPNLYALPRCLAGDQHCRAARGKISWHKILFGRNVPWLYPICSPASAVTMTASKVVCNALRAASWPSQRDFCRARVSGVMRSTDGGGSWSGCSADLLCLAEAAPP